MMGTEKYYIVTAGSLNIRSGPGTDYEILGTLEQEEEVISPITEGWVPVLMEDDTTAWVAGKYLREVSEEKLEKPKPAPSQVSLLSSPIFQKELTEKFGTPNYRQFVRTNLVTIDLSEFADSFAHVRTFNGKPFTSVEGHKIMAEPLKMALRLVCERDLAKEMKTYDGCFNIREMKSSGSLSVHSWGLALDFNARTSPFQTPSSPNWPEMITDFSDDFVSCFAEAGFEWGGLWKSIYDPMHFQLPWTKDWQESSAALRPKICSGVPPAATPPQPTKVPVASSEFDFSTPEGTIAAIKAECAKQGIGSPEQVAYVLATVKHETGGTFMPVREAFYISKDFDKAEAWRKANLRYYPFYGRGYVQLTWEDNYRKYSDILGIDLVKEPDLALEPPIALFILVHGFKTGAFTGKRLTDYLNAEKTDFTNARRCINRLDKAEEIAGLAKELMVA